MRLVLAILVLMLTGCVSTRTVSYAHVSEPTLWLVEMPVGGVFTHPALAYGEGSAWEMIELLESRGPTHTSPPRINQGRVRGRWHGETARDFWDATVRSGRYAEWQRPYKLGDSNAYVAWLESMHNLPGFDLGSRAYGENNAR